MSINAIFGGITRSIGKKALLAIETKGRTDVQKSVINYFNTEGGCSGSLFGMKDKDFDGVLAEYVNRLNLEQMAMDKLAVDKSQINEISAVYLDGYYFDYFRFLGQAALGNASNKINASLSNKDSSDSVGTYVKIGNDGVPRFSKYKLSCIFCGIDQMYIYSFRFDLTNLNTSEETAEFFYKDIDSVKFAVKNEDMAIHPKGCLGFLQPPKYVAYPYPEILITVPGNSFKCSMRMDNESAIHGLKNLIRDKKRQ